jgi:hypothetical protein
MNLNVLDMQVFLHVIIVLTLLLHKISFTNCDTNILATSATTGEIIGAIIMIILAILGIVLWIRK